MKGLNPTLFLSPVAEMQLRLPWPPTINTYWRHVGAKVLISQKGRDYRDDIADTVLGQRKRMTEGRYRVLIEAYPPDHRKRDLDNLTKSLLDALTHAGVYDDDCRIDDLRIVRMPVQPGDGFVRVTIEIALATELTV